MIACWARPLVDPSTWRGLAYLLATFPMGQLWFILLVATLAIGVSLSVILVGIPILAGSVMAWRFGADVERRIARVVMREEIPARLRADWSAGFLRTAWSHVTDPATWREVLYLALLFPLGMFWLAALLMVWALPFALTWSPLLFWIDGGWVVFSFGRDGWLVDTFAEGVAAGLIGVAVLPFAARFTRGAGRLQLALARSLLGRSSTGRLREQVETLERRRAASVDSAEAERKRIERDLHDGAQQRLVALAMDLGRAREKLDDDPDSARVLVDEAHQHAKQALSELRDLARGIHPAVLTDRGLDAALSALAARSHVPVTVVVDLPDRPDASVESTTYFVASEALANVSKHALASHAKVTIGAGPGYLQIAVEDDGVGGADPAGSGLSGLADRVEAIGGALSVLSPIGGPTLVEAVLPCAW